MRVVKKGSDGDSEGGRESRKPSVIKRHSAAAAAWL